MLVILFLANLKNKVDVFDEINEMKTGETSEDVSHFLWLYMIRPLTLSSR